MPRRRKLPPVRISAWWTEPAKNPNSLLHPAAPRIFVRCILSVPNSAPSLAAPSAVKEKLPAKAAPNQSKKETKPQGKQAAQKRGKPSKKKAVQKTRRGKRNYTLYYLTFGLFSAIVLLILSYTVLFPVTDITVKTTDPEIVISPEAAQTYIESSGLSKGNNLLRVNAKTTEQNILASDPTIDAVTLHKKLPGKLVVEVNVARPWCAFYNAADKLYYSVSENGRVIAAGKKKELPLTEKTVFVTGFTLEDCEVGSYYDERAVLQKRVDAADAALAKAKEADKPQAEKDKMAAESELRRYELYLTMRDKLVEYGLTEVTAMDMRRSSNISFTWQKRVRVELGGYTDMEYKLKLANTILTQELDAKAKGTLNLSVPKLPGFREDL